MFTNYIKTAWRSIRKNGFHSFINVFGLSIGLLFALLIGSYVWNIATNHTYTTPQALKILGLGEDWQITDLMDRVHPADLSLVTKAWEKTLSGGGDFDIEYRCRVNNEEKMIQDKPAE